MLKNEKEVPLLWNITDQTVGDKIEIEIVDAIPEYLPVPNEEDFLKYCSFCGNSEVDANNMVAGIDGNICDLCVKKCNEILAKDKNE